MENKEKSAATNQNKVFTENHIWYNHKEMSLQPTINKFAKCLADIFGTENKLSIPSMPLSAQALLTLALSHLYERTIVLIADGPESLETMHRNISALSQDKYNLTYLPSIEQSTGSNIKNDQNITGYRLNALFSLLNEKQKPTIICTCIQAMMQKTFSPEGLRKNTILFERNNELELVDATNKLVRSGYDFKPEVFEKGKASLKGGILDVWAPTETWPARIEFNGSVIESIRSFNPADQRSVDKLEKISIPPARHPESTMRSSLMDFLGSDTMFIWSQANNIKHYAQLYTETMDNKPASVSLQTIRSRIKIAKDSLQVFIETDEMPFDKTPTLPSFQPIHGAFNIEYELFQPDTNHKTRQKLIATLCEEAQKGKNVAIFFDTEGALDHFKSNFLKSIKKFKLKLCTGSLSEGFVCAELNTIIVTESEVYGRKKLSRRRYSPKAREAALKQAEKLSSASSDLMHGVAELADIEPGDFVVHSEYGIGRYRGLYEITFDGKLQEVLTIEYAEKSKLHVPVSQAHLISRYIGIARQGQPLHKLGGKKWQNQTTAAKSSIAVLALSLLRIQAQRNMRKGFAFPSDKSWQHDFENSFPYQETQDQHEAIISVKGDMESVKPMDRLICGDAGYGKTEVAMRAAFKTALTEKQTAILVPTTILAQQHFQTFTERMAPYPVRVEMLSRFCPESKKNEIIKGLADGSVDIVIGTHALVQPAIRFKDLGLVIIDEEQRFGVKHKERLKQIKNLVDVLTLTATPIPRTLYMSMIGARDITLIQTPPRERMAIETIVAQSSDKILREAILREINREGQVYFLHNRVMTIERQKKRLIELVPEARIEVAHGQMSSSELSSVMKLFIAGEIDVLLCTTIIESGMDIPRANTILIDRSDRFGIADLYQLRGRVGRSKHKAYAYLLIPAHGHIDATARKRIEAIKKYSSLSAGFNIALRDLEIRGAGNLLGSEQSGHINAIGFGLYCQLLKRAIAQLRDESLPPVINVDILIGFITLSPGSTFDDNAAIIPYSYIEDEKLRFETYKRIAEATFTEDISKLLTEFEDRFGSAPPSFKRLLQIAELRIIAASKGISQVETRDDKIMLHKDGAFIMKDGKFPRLAGSSAKAKLDSIKKVLVSSVD